MDLAMLVTLMQMISICGLMCPLIDDIGLNRTKTYSANPKVECNDNFSNY